MPSLPMSSLTSVPSAKSLLSPKLNGHASADKLLDSYGPSSAIHTASYQQTLNSARLPQDGLNLTPDELFTKQTVSEVRAVQQRLRADADAKQEELRLMVGERYRDLLQASSSIISIASSSQRVLKAIEESREAIVSQHALPAPPKTAAIDGLDDKHLFTLQVLSAHMKLLLDAPEHLWRLIERKKYFHAAWLFLLARVVHQALLQNDENDEQSWISEGVDVSVEFPLVQRQWDIVSQFRSQITHKSTLSLREASSSTEDTCATLVTLHLLDSRPLNDALAALLIQRSKTLKSLLSRNSKSGSNKSSTTGNVTGNGHVSSSKTVSVREITQIMKDSLNTISQTVHSVRVIFQDGTQSPSLIIRVLESIQEDDSVSETRRNTLPDSLQLSTQTLLTQLTSAANFQILPPNLKMYAPYIDLKSASTSLSSLDYSQKLQEWFYGSSKQWQQAAEKWFFGLPSVKDVWMLRNSIKRSISGSGFSETEANHMHSILDTLCHTSIDKIWLKTLTDAETDCKNRFRQVVFSKDNNKSADISPVEYLFQTPSIPILSQTVKAFVETPFQKYQNSLKRQLVGRSVQLNNVISTLEQCARAIQLDFAHLRVGGDVKTSAPLLERLTKAYQPHASALSTNVATFIAEAATEVAQDPAQSTDGLAFISRVTADLSNSSLFIKGIGCSPESAKDFKGSMVSINQNVVQKWREITVNRIFQQCKSSLQKRSLQSPTGPSAQVFQALMSLCDSIRQLGVFYLPVGRSSVAEDVLLSFIELWANDMQDYVEPNVYDIAFLQKLASQHNQTCANASTILTKRLQALIPGEAARADVDKIVSDFLARTQTLLSVIIPLPSAPAFDPPLLQIGVPLAGQVQHSAIDLAKPSPRFGMLLVGTQDR